jgi:hypothetical protein
VELQWRKIVGDYGRLNLTFKKDKLPAISGAVREMQPMRGRYLAGLWEDTFFDDIIWQRKITSPLVLMNDAVQHGHDINQ